MAYRVELAPSAARRFKRLSRSVQARLGARIDALAQDPRPHGMQQLSAPERFYCIREGDYCIIYQVQDEAQLVLVLKVGHRREVYRRLLR